MGAWEEEWLARRMRRLLLEYDDCSYEALQWVPWEELSLRYKEGIRSGWLDHATGMDQRLKMGERALKDDYSWGYAEGWIMREDVRGED